MNKLINENYISKSAPASTVSTETCNAATQTERVSRELVLLTHYTHQILNN